MNRRKFLKQFGGLAAAGFILPDAAVASSPYSMIIPAQGVTGPSQATPPGLFKPFGNATTSSFRVIDTTSIDMQSTLETASDAGTYAPTAANGGIFLDKLFYGDFSLTFQVNPWPGLSSGLLGVGVMDSSNNVISAIAEFASYPEWDSGNPFRRIRNPYTYDSTYAPMNAPLSLSVSRTNGIVTGGTWWAGASPYTRELPISNQVKPFIYYLAGVTWAGSLGFTAQLRSIQISGS